MHSQKYQQEGKEEYCAGEDHRAPLLAEHGNSSTSPALIEKSRMGSYWGLKGAIITERISLLRAFSFEDGHSCSEYAEQIQIQRAMRHVVILEFEALVILEFEALVILDVRGARNTRCSRRS